MLAFFSAILAFLPLVTASLFSSVAVSADEGLAALAFPPGMYFAAKVLEDTIQSIVTQTYKNLEYIIVDGGSTDETLDIIHKYQEHITTVISEPDQGLYDAMNKGIKLATGDYLCFLNAGDGLHEDDTLLQMVHSINGTALPGVLYELGDYDPPVMIDTVMGVLDKESREVIINRYFPDLAHQYAIRFIGRCQDR